MVDGGNKGLKEIGMFVFLLEKLKTFHQAQIVLDFPGVVLQHQQHIRCHSYVYRMVCSHHDERVMSDTGH